MSQPDLAVRRSSTTGLQGLDAAQETESNPTALSPVSPGSKLKASEEEKAEMKDEVNKVRNLEEKVEEYEQVIACIQKGYEELEGEYKSIIDFMDHYIEELSPLYIRKCQVPNKGGRRGTWF